MKNKNQVLNFILLFIFTFIVLFFSLKDNFQSVIDEILHLEPIWLLLSVLLVFFHLWFKACSLRSVIIKFKPKYSLGKAFHLTLVTQFFNAITPFSTGGQPFQVYTLKKDGIGVTAGTNIIMQNFIVYQIALVFLGIFTVLYNAFFHIFKEVRLLKHLVVIGFFINTIVIVVLFLIAFGKRFNTFILEKGILFLQKIKLIKNGNAVLQRWNTYISNFHEGARTLFLDKKLFIKTFIQNFISLLFIYMIPFTLLQGMHFYKISLIECIVASSYTMLIGAFVPIPGGTGGLEYGYLRFFGAFVTGPILRASMLLWRGLTYYLGLICGAVAFNIKRR